MVCNHSLAQNGAEDLHIYDSKQLQDLFILTASDPLLSHAMHIRQRH